MFFATERLNGAIKNARYLRLKNFPSPEVIQMTSRNTGAVAKIQKLLLRRRDALRQTLAGELSTLKQFKKGDEVDVAIDSAQTEISSHLAETESRELAAVEAALERIRSGAYGQCDGCGGKIPKARLEALPYATLCINCQREMEETGEIVNRPDWAKLPALDLDDEDDKEVTFNDIEVNS
jgi:DnaK suppressor protein